MSYTRHIKEKKFAWGGRAFVTTFPAGDSVSFVGSMLAGTPSTKDDELAVVHAQMLLEGTAQLRKRDIQIELDCMGAQLNFGATNDRLVFGGRVRTVHVESLLALISEILEKSTFPAQELAILKRREEANLALQSQDTKAQAATLLSRRLFPKDHPNYAQTTKEARAALKRISSAKLRAYHHKLLNRNSLVFSIAGDIAPDRAFSLAEKYFKTLPNKKITVPKLPKTAPPRATRAIVRLPEKANIDYLVGIAARITKDHKDYPALMLGIQILGTPGFTGRLMQIIREKEGLTYGVYSYLLGFESGADGYFNTWGTFSPLLFGRGREGIRREIGRLVEEGVTEEEVRKHAKLFAARMHVAMSTSGAFAKAAHGLGVEGRPISYLDTFTARVLRLTQNQVNAALKKYIKPMLLVEAAAGPIEKF